MLFADTNCINYPLLLLGGEPLMSRKLDRYNHHNGERERERYLHETFDLGSVAARESERDRVAAWSHFFGAL